MSKAFTKESDGADEVLPVRPVSPHRNFVTAAGLALIEDAVQRLGREHAAARQNGDVAALARVDRDLHYWRERKASAELQPEPPDSGQVRFGSTVMIRREEGGCRTWRIVGEDEADPARGTISYMSPVAQALLGAKVGDVVRAGPSEVEIIRIS